MGGEAYKTLERISQADELAVRSGSEMSELDYWIEQFEKESVAWREQVDTAFGDSEKMQELQGKKLAADRAEQAANQAKLAGALESKMQSMISSLGGVGISGLESALDSNVNTLKELNVARDKSDYS